MPLATVLECMNERVFGFMFEIIVAKM